jgi:hypothetical protein
MGISQSYLQIQEVFISRMGTQPVVKEYPISFKWYWSTVDCLQARHIALINRDNTKSIVMVSRRGTKRPSFSQFCSHPEESKLCIAIK